MRNNGIFEGDPDKVEMTEFAKEFHELANDIISETIITYGGNPNLVVPDLGGRLAALRLYIEGIGHTEKFNDWVLKTTKMMPSEQAIKDGLK